MGEVNVPDLDQASTEELQRLALLYGIDPTQTKVEVRRRLRDVLD